MDTIGNHIFLVFSVCYHSSPFRLPVVDRRLSTVAYCPCVWETLRVTQLAGKLTAAFVAFVKSARHSGRTGRPEKHYDVHGLFLQVMPSGSKQFVQRLVVAGKRNDYGLGGYPIISLAEAREAAWGEPARGTPGRGPEVEARRRVTVARRAGEALPVTGGPRGPTFAAAFEQVLATRAPSWKESVRASSVRSWRQHLRDYLGAYRRAPRRGPVECARSSSRDAALGPRSTRRHRSCCAVSGTSCNGRSTQGLRTDDPVPAVARTLPKVQAAPNHYRALPPRRGCGRARHGCGRAAPGGRCGWRSS